MFPFFLVCAIIHSAVLLLGTYIIYALSNICEMLTFGYINHCGGFGSTALTLFQSLDAGRECTADQQKNKGSVLIFQVSELNSRIPRESKAESQNCHLKLSFSKFYHKWKQWVKCLIKLTIKFSTQELNEVTRSWLEEGRHFGGKSSRPKEKWGACSFWNRITTNRINTN